MTGWVTLFLLLIIIEAFIGDFTALAISTGAVFAAIAAFIHVPVIIQSIIFALVSTSSFMFFRPYLQKKLIPHTHNFTADSFIGTTAEVIEKITKDKKGRVRVGGEIWFAESPIDIDAGEKVIISEIESAVMKVVPEKHITDNQGSQA